MENSMKNSDEVAIRLNRMEIIAKQAGQLAMSYFRSHIPGQRVKGPQDFVSEADCRVEALIRKSISKAFHNDGIIGEEYGFQKESSRYTWVVDPIDGTTVFLSGLPGWVISLALLENREVVAGVIYDPCGNESFKVHRGHNAWLNNMVLPKLASSDLESGLVGIGFPGNGDPKAFGGLMAALLERGGNFYRNGSAASMLAQVAAGRLAGLYQTHLNAWDCFAGLLLIEETGGNVLPYDVEKMITSGGPVLGAAPGVFEQLLEIVPVK